MIEARQAELDAFLEQVFPTNSGAAAAIGRRTACPFSDEWILRKARGAANGEKFRRLWAGDWQGDYPSQSETDLALVSLLAFYTGPDPARIEALFRQSGLMREKWDRRDYRERTIRRVLDAPDFMWWGTPRPRADEEGADDAPTEEMTGWVMLDAATVDAWDFPRTAPLIDGLLPAIGLVWIGGLPKRFKSLLLLYLCLAIACRRPDVGLHFAIRGSPKILYVSKEDPGARLKERITDILLAWPIRPQPNAITFLIRPRLDLDRAKDVVRLRELCRRDGIRMLVLDTWTALSPGANPLEAGDQKRLAQVVAGLAQAIGGLVVVVDHNRKNRPEGHPLSSADIYGPHQKWAYADAILMLDLTSDRRRLEVFVESKDADTDRFFLTISARGSGTEKFTYAGSAAEVTDRQRTQGGKNERAVLRVAFKNPGAWLTATAFESGTTLSHSTVAKHLAALVHAAHLEREGSGKSTRYRLVPMPSAQSGCDEPAQGEG